MPQWLGWALRLARSSRGIFYARNETAFNGPKVAGGQGLLSVGHSTNIICGNSRELIRSSRPGVFGPDVTYAR
jgi:hypothetical protein